MKIKTKLFLSLIFIAILSMVISLNFSIISISSRYEKMAKEEIAAAKKVAESVFLENLGDLVRKALFLSELKEIIENTGNQDELAMALEFKNFFFSNINIKILDPAGKIVLIHDNSADNHLSELNLGKITFLNKQRDPLMREAGVFLIDGNLCMAAISPIVDQETFTLKGFMLLEIPFNLEFADQIKEKAKTDIMVYSQDKPITSTLTDSNGEMVFLRPAKANPDEMVRFHPGGDRYLLDAFAVDDYQKQKVGEIFVAVNIEKIMAAKQVSIYGLLYIALVIGFFVILTSIFLGNRLTSPIVNLAHSAEAITGGNFDVHMNLHSKDEIGNLANAFNKMSDSLKIQRDEILELQQFFEKIFEHSPSAIFICNELAEVVTMNQAAEKLFEKPLYELKGKQFFECLPLFNPLKEDYFKVLLSGNPSFFNNFSVVSENGNEKVLRLTLYKIPLPDTQYEVLQIEDVSEKLELQEKLLHAQKMGTLGELLSRFTHEFNNLMTGLLGHVSLLKREVGKENPHFKRAQMIEDVSLRAYNLGKDILVFSKKEKLKKKSLDVSKAIEIVLNLFGKTILKKIEIETKFQSGTLNILINKEKFLLAIFNVLINAKDAIWTAQREKGRISIIADRIFISKEEKNYIRIKIADNGTGIEEKLISKIFEPYFTTKGEKGTGLGLTTVKEIIKESAGWIEIDVEKGAGTVFIIFLPEYIA
jgi:PAS domain S-box-containing protein